MGTLFCEDVSMMEKWSLLSVDKVGIGLNAANSRSQLRPFRVLRSITLAQYMYPR